MKEIRIHLPLLPLFNIGMLHILIIIPLGNKEDKDNFILGIGEYSCLRTRASIH